MNKFVKLWCLLIVQAPGTENNEKTYLVAACIYIATVNTKIEHNYYEFKTYSAFSILSIVDFSHATVKNICSLTSCVKLIKKYYGSWPQGLIYFSATYLDQPRTEEAYSIRKLFLLMELKFRILYIQICVIRIHCQYSKREFELTISNTLIWLHLVIQNISVTYSSTACINKSYICGFMGVERTYQGYSFGGLIRVAHTTQNSHWSKSIRLSIKSDT
jgi:hypothetical protein